MAYHQGNLQQNTIVNLQQPNFKYIGKAKGMSSIYYILLWGGRNHETLVGDAMESLKSTYRLQDNQAYANITVNYKYDFYFPLGIFERELTCTITADIIEFTN